MRAPGMDGGGMTRMGVGGGKAAMSANKRTIRWVRIIKVGGWRNRRRSNAFASPSAPLPHSPDSS
jgi:hypothetical protein